MTEQNCTNTTKQLQTVQQRHQQHNQITYSMGVAKMLMNILGNWPSSVARPLPDTLLKNWRNTTWNRQLQAK